ncbi:hypothetical protein Syun_001820 [Stephania yunnanensis]|uniref:Uncharacterized protein n=1 Tax=Stephania yunnanensis TaxID=152371 RepID=A0AAP0LHG9_9MAGN
MALIPPVGFWGSQLEPRVDYFITKERKKLQYHVCKINSQSVLARTYGGNIEGVYGFAVAELARLGYALINNLSGRNPTKRYSCSSSSSIPGNEKIDDFI